MPLQQSLATLSTLSTLYELNPNDANLIENINESIENNGIEIDRAIGIALHRIHEIKPTSKEQDVEKQQLLCRITQMPYYIRMMMDGCQFKQQRTKANGVTFLFL